MSPNPNAGVAKQSNVCDSSTAEGASTHNSDKEDKNSTELCEQTNENDMKSTVLAGEVAENCSAGENDLCTESAQASEEQSPEECSDVKQSENDMGKNNLHSKTVNTKESASVESQINSDATPFYPKRQARPSESESHSFDSVEMTSPGNPDEVPAQKSNTIPAGSYQIPTTSSSVSENVTQVTDSNSPNLFLYSPSSNTIIPCEEIIIPNHPNIMQTVIKDAAEKPCFATDGRLTSDVGNNTKITVQTVTSASTAMPNMVESNVSRRLLSNGQENEHGYSAENSNSAKTGATTPATPGLYRYHPIDN